jgi:S1-C subfamily serine protease
VKVREGAHGAGSAELTLTAGETADVTVSLAEKLPVALTMLDANTRRPIAWARIAAAGVEGERADAAGNAVVYFEAGEHQLSIEADGYTALALAVAAGQPAQAELQPVKPLAAGGVGISWTGDRSRCVVGRPLDGGPAALAGIRTNDIIYAVNGISVQGSASAAELIRGPVGKPVTLLVRRDGAAMSFTLVRVELSALQKPSPP